MDRSEATASIRDQNRSELIELEIGKAGSGAGQLLRNIEEWLRENDKDSKKAAYRKIIIPKGMKQEFRERLALLGIKSTTIYPDLDGLGKELRKKYAYREQQTMGCQWLGCERP